MLLVLLVFLVLLLIGMPIAFSIGISSLVFFLIYKDLLPLSIPPQLMLAQTQIFSFMAIPLFIMAGNIMNRSGITRRIFRFFSLLLGSTKGNIAYVSAIANTLMGGISSSPLANVILGSRVMGYEMLKNDFPKGFTSNVISFSTLSASIIPPAISLILIGTVGGISVGKLFWAGIVPSIFLMLLIIISISYVTRNINVEVISGKVDLKDLLNSFTRSIWAFVLPIGVILTLRGGLLSPEQVGSYAILYSIFVGVYIYKELTFQRFLSTLEDTIVDLGTIFSLVMFSGIVGYGLVYDNIPTKITEVIYTVFKTPTLVFLMLILLSLLFALFLDSTILTLTLGRVFLPVAVAVGIDPIHFGILFVLVTVLGNILPPMGPSLYTACSILNSSISEHTKYFLVFFICILIGILILILLPQLILFLPNTFIR